MKERSQNSFLTSLFSNKRESVDRDNLFEGSGYSKSRSNNTVQNLDPSVLEQSISATGELIEIKAGKVDKSKFEKI